MAWARRG
ncbi:hypothetical protein YPPY15_4571, partial [Yersinia pestis PY-15]